MNVIKVYLSIALVLAIVAFVGCGTRTSIPQEEAVTVHTITTAMDQKAAFFATEEALASSWNSWKDVNQLRQPETGTLLAKGLFGYTDMMAANNAEVEVKAKVQDGTISLTYTIGRNRDAWKAFPSANAVKQMREQFTAMTESVAKAVDGKISP